MRHGGVHPPPWPSDHCTVVALWSEGVSQHLWRVGHCRQTAVTSPPLQPRRTSGLDCARVPMLHNTHTHTRARARTHARTHARTRTHTQYLPRATRQLQANSASAEQLQYKEKDRRVTALFQSRWSLFMSWQPSLVPFSVQYTLIFLRILTISLSPSLSLSLPLSLSLSLSLSLCVWVVVLLQL